MAKCLGCSSTGHTKDKPLCLKCWRRLHGEKDGEKGKPSSGKKRARKK